MTTPRRPTVSIVIPAYNEAAFIKACLDACLEQTELPQEILVIDNRSTDDTAAIVKKLQQTHPNGGIIRLLAQSSEQGLIPTRNFGFSNVQSDVIGRIDADSVIAPTWVAAVAEAFSDEQLDAATGPVSYSDMPAKKLGLLCDDFVRRNLARLAHDYAFLFGSNMAIRTRSWHKIAATVCRDKADLLHEDIDIALHAHQAGMEIVYLKRMIGGMSARRLKDSPRDFYDYIMRYERTYAQHGVRQRSARLPIVLYLALYPTLKALYTVYNVAPERLPSKLRVLLAKN